MSTDSGFDESQMPMVLTRPARALWVSRVGTVFVALFGLAAVGVAIELPVSVGAIRLAIAVVGAAFFLVMIVSVMRASRMRIVLRAEAMDVVGSFRSRTIARRSVVEPTNVAALTWDRAGTTRSISLTALSMYRDTGRRDGYDDVLRADTLRKRALVRSWAGLPVD